MDFDDEINRFLDNKSISKKAVSVQKSILHAFARWQQMHPSRSYLEDARRYAAYLGSHEIYTPGSRRKRARLVEEFCAFITAEDRFELPVCQNLVMENESLRPIPAPSIHAKELARCCSLRLDAGWRPFRDAAMALLAYSCSLSPRDISSLLLLNLKMGIDEGALSYHGFWTPLPMLTFDVLRVFLYGRPDKRIDQPLFTVSKEEPDTALTPQQVKSSLAAFAEGLGYEYDELFHLSPQLIIAQHIDALAPGNRAAVAAFVLSEFFGGDTIEERITSRKIPRAASVLWQ